MHHNSSFHGAYIAFETLAKLVLPLWSCSGYFFQLGAAIIISILHGHIDASIARTCLAKASIFLHYADICRIALFPVTPLSVPGIYPAVS